MQHRPSRAASASGPADPVELGPWSYGVNRKKADEFEEWLAASGRCRIL